MTKKDYELIARALLSAQPNEAWLNKHQQWLRDCMVMGNALMETNPLFDYNRFLAACGIED
jgi:hypothetical protein